MIYEFYLEKNTYRHTLDEHCSKYLENNDVYIKLNETITGDKLHNNEYIFYYEQNDISNYMCVRVGTRYVCSFNFSYKTEDKKYIDDIIKNLYYGLETPNINFIEKQWNINE